MNLRIFAFLLLGVVTIVNAQKVSLPGTIPVKLPAQKTPKARMPSGRFIKSLTGLWIATKYKKALYRTNSMVRAEKLTPFYTDFYFGGDSLIWLGRPYLMEPREFIFNPLDSTARSRAGKVVLKVLGVGRGQLRLYAPRYGNLTFTSVRPDTSRFEPPWLQMMGAAHHVNQQWIAGSYSLLLNGDTTALTLNAKNGTVSNILFDKYDVFAWNKFDFLLLTNTNGSTDQSKWKIREFIIESVVPKQIALTEIEPIENDSQPIVKTGKTALLLRQ